MFSKSKDDPKMANADDIPVPAPQPTKSSRPTGAPVAPSIIGADVHIVGNVTTAGELQLDGTVQGDVMCGSLTMGEHGEVKGTIQADMVVIRGKIDGQIRGRSVRLEKNCRMKGDVWHESLSVEAGALVSGKFTHTQNPLKGETAPVAAVSAGSSSPVKGSPAKSSASGPAGKADSKPAENADKVAAA